MKTRNATMLAIAGVALTSACTRVQVTGEFDGEPLLVSGTGVAWLDETVYVVDDPSAPAELDDRATDDTVLHLRFFEAVFDPTVDFGALPAAERKRIEDDIARGDQLLAEVHRGNTVRAGDAIELVDPEDELPPELMPYLSSVDVRFGARSVGTDAYPDVAPRLGGDKKAGLLVDATSPEMRARLTLEVDTGEQEDEDDVVTGKVTVKFALELIPERVAECNFARAGAGAVDPCTLNERGGASAAAGR